MAQQNRSLIRAITLGSLALCLAACGGNSSSTTPPPTGGGGTTPPPVARQEDQFGAAFATAFRADNNSEPFNVSDGDIVAISLTTEPVTIN